MSLESRGRIIEVQRSIASFSIEARVQLFIAYLSAMHLWCARFAKRHVSFVYSIFIWFASFSTWSLIRSRAKTKCISVLYFPAVTGTWGPAMLACVSNETFARDIFLKGTPPTLQADWPRHDLEHSVKTWLYNSIEGRNIRMVDLQWSFCESGHIVILLKTWRSKCLIWMLEWHPPPVYVILV